MQWKRLFYYLLINILVSTITILIVLSIWDRTHRADTVALPTIASLPVSATATAPVVETSPAPTLALQTYQVSPGETLGDIALAYDISVEELLAINGLNDPDTIGTGAVIFVPLPGGSNPEEAQTDPAVEGEANPGEVPPANNGDQVQISAVIGAGDLSTERVQLRGQGEGSLLLTGWRLVDEDNNEFIFPQITLFGNGAVDVYSGAGRDTVVALYWDNPSAIWESGETVTLYDEAGAVQATYEVP